MSKSISKIAVMFSQETSEWETALDDYHYACARWGVTYELDVCATARNSKCQRFIDPIQDGLLTEWDAPTVWMNPPYGNSLNLIKLYHHQEKLASSFIGTNGRFNSQAFRKLHPILAKEYTTNIYDWVKKAHIAATHYGRLVTGLLPARTETKWWHDFIWDHKAMRPYPGVDVDFAKGRLYFGGAENSAPFPSVFVTWDRRASERYLVAPTAPRRRVA